MRSNKSLQHLLESRMRPILHLPKCELLAQPWTRPSIYTSRQLHDRIQQLKDLVISIMRKAAPCISIQEFLDTSQAQEPRFSSNDLPATSQFDDQTRDILAHSESGNIKFTGQGARYVNSAHWAAVLGSITELKCSFEQETPDVAPTSRASDPTSLDFAGPQLLYGCPQCASKEKILSSMPPRSVVNQLVSCYFNSFNICPG